jgi:hypothetical protein
MAHFSRVEIITTNAEGHMDREVIALADLHATMVRLGSYDTGFKGPIHLREGLRGLPKFKGFAGPKYGREGDEDLVRYEDSASFERLSR